MAPFRFLWCCLLLLPPALAQTPGAPPQAHAQAATAMLRESSADPEAGSSAAGTGSAAGGVTGTATGGVTGTATASAPANLSRTARQAPALAPDAPYTVGSGDLLSLSVWKEKELSQIVTVRPDGKISMPLIGELSVVGMTPVQVEAELKSQLASLVVNPRVTVTVVEIHSRMVYITGEVGRPGAYPLNAPLNVLQLIAQAGGLTEFAARKKIRIVRAGSSDKGIAFDYSSVLRSGNNSRNLPLAPGDTVVVP